MKERYNAPELTVISFVPDARIATFDFDDALNGEFNPKDSVPLDDLE